MSTNPIHAERIEEIARYLAMADITASVEHPGYVHVDIPGSSFPETEEPDYLAGGYDGDGLFLMDVMSASGRGTRGIGQFPDRVDTQLLAVAMAFAMHGFAKEETGGGCQAYSRGDITVSNYAELPTTFVEQVTASVSDKAGASIGCLCFRSVLGFLTFLKRYGDDASAMLATREGEFFNP
jgi:hypothetical protein